jgi:hypothetical protein
VGIESTYGDRRHGVNDRDVPVFLATAPWRSRQSGRFATGREKADVALLFTPFVVPVRRGRPSATGLTERNRR